MLAACETMTVLHIAEYYVHIQQITELLNTGQDVVL